MIRLILFLCMVSISLSSIAQKSKIKVFPQDNQEFSSAKIIGGLASHGVKILEVETNFDSTSHAMGFFIDPVRYMGMEQGLILSTGVVDQVTQANSTSNYTSLDLNTSEENKILKVYLDSQATEKQKIDLTDSILVATLLAQQDHGDADLSEAINGMKTYDARVIKIKFIPTADTLYYRYVFASEEYEEYVCSQFNDIFALYLYEEGQPKKNIALIPGQQLPVSINTINNGNPKNEHCPKSNPYLFQLNNGNQNLLYDGFTKVLDVRQKVIPGKVYWIKIAIADVSDKVLDSAVLLENKSIFSYFGSYELRFDNNSAFPKERAKLEKVVAQLQEHPKSKVQLIGHTDLKGRADYNFRLSIKRVRVVKEFLMDSGINESRILESYKGETMPRYKEIAKNRRVEVFVLGE
ncbi:MAG: OmpA family protein [Aureispira sp.]|nr:OmpA family protein [Aureispira sp.]